MPHKRAKLSSRVADRSKRGFDSAPSGSGSSKQDFEDYPKGAMRIFNSAKIQADYMKRKKAGFPEDEGKGKRKSSEDTGESSKKKQKKDPNTPDLKIQQGESMKHFSRRVEDSLRSSVSAASQKAKEHSREFLKAEKEERIAKQQKRVEDDAKRKAEKLKAENGSDEMDEEEEGVSKKESKPAQSEPKKNKHEGKKTEFDQFSSSAPKRLNDIAMAPPTFTALPRGASKITSSAGKSPLSAAQMRILSEERERVIRLYREGKERKAEQAEAEKAKIKVKGAKKVGNAE